MSDLNSREGRIQRITSTLANKKLGTQASAPSSRSGSSKTSKKSSSEFQGIVGLKRGSASPINAPTNPGGIVAPPQTSNRRSSRSSSPEASIGTIPPPNEARPEIPGVSGITPGAIERRLGIEPSLQALGGIPPSPSQALNTPVMQHTPNLTGPSRGALNSPLAMIQQLLQGRRQ